VKTELPGTQRAASNGRGRRAEARRQGIASLHRCRPACLALATLSFQIAVIVNAERGLPHRNVPDAAAAFQSRLGTPRI